MDWYIAVLKKYVEFTGRARRKEYWMFALISLVVSVALGVVGRILGTSALSYLYSLAILLPGIAVTIRRLHDTGRSGWMSLIGIIPVLGWIVLLVFMAQDSTPGTNQYGLNPKETVVPAVLA